jgi:PAP2 superfamily
MPHFMLSWQDAALIALALGAVSVVTYRRFAVAAGVAREAGLLFGLYGLWQFAGKFTALSAAGGIARGQWIWHAERVLHLPSETWVQRLFLPHPLVIEAFNLYYDILHFPMLIACLIWVYAWHRPDYPRIRTLVVLFTAASLLVQLIPVAPPRLLPGTGLVDTAFEYGQSVYTWGHGVLEADQYSAMPSVHVGWALIVAIAIITVSRSRWRWLAALYPALTTVVVVVTANHFWFDGLAAAILVAASVLAEKAIRGRAFSGGRRPSDHELLGDGEPERIGTRIEPRRDQAA